MSRKFLTALDLAKNELQNAVVQNLAGAPSSPVKGQLYMNTSDNTLYWWDGTLWQPAKSGAPAFGSVVTETAFGQASANGSLTTVARSDHTHGTPVHDNAAHSAVNLNALAAPVATMNMGGQLVQNVMTPLSPQDAATKAYVDNLSAGLSWKDAVRCASTAQRALTGLAAIDGVTPVANDRVLLKNQTAPAENGIYLAQSGAWSRAADADLAAEVEGLAVFVMEGTAHGDQAWVCTTNAPITLGTTALTFVQFGAASVYTAGAGLTGTTTFDVGAGTGITVAADTVALDTAYADGRYALTAAGAKRYAVDVGGATSQVLTHNLNTLDVIVQVYRKAGPNDQIECDVEHTSVNTSTVRFAVAPSAAEYRAVVMA